MSRISHQVSIDLKRAFINLYFNNWYSWKDSNFHSTVSKTAISAIELHELMVDKGRFELPTPETYRVTADWGYQFSNSSILK